MLSGFPFSADKDAHVLILGSMPGRKSLDEQQYYAHPRNAFWPVMEELFGFEAALPYAQRLRLLRNNGVALWDVAHQCIRPGSLDADIREVEANDFSGFFAVHTRIGHIFFNGRKAESLFLKMVQPYLAPEQQRLTKHLLPSSSPAHAALSFDEKLAAWKIVHNICTTPLKSPRLDPKHSDKRLNSISGEHMSQATTETRAFQTEVKQLLDLMIHSLYSNKEIFLRELISNASDAADKLRFEATTDDALFEGDSDLNVYIAVDKDARTITVRDNGIGMSRDEVVDNIGTIARSGTREFFDNLSGDKDKDAHLIGQFGVGFYSSFLVADRVTLTTRRAGLEKEHGVRWESAGDGEYTLETVEIEQRGTEIVLHLREEADEFLDDYRLRSIIHKYADHIPFPIRMLGEPQSVQGEEGEEATILPAEIETVNQASALWTRPKSELSDEDYDNFYKHIGHDFEAPLARLHQRLEGKYEYTLLLYLPKQAPFDLWQAEARHGVKLYVKRVFIMEAGEDLLPRYLRFVRGVMDSNDLPLNVSREILQKSPAMEAMKKGATKRVLALLEEMNKDKPEDYAAFWQEFGNCLKEGVVEDFASREKLSALLRFSSTEGASTETSEQKVSLGDYVGRMKDGQDSIYFITADTLAAASHSPHLEVFRKKGIEVLLMHDRIDEWLLSHLTEFDGKKLKSIAKGELDLSAIGSDEEKEAEKKAEEEAAKTVGPAVEKIKKALGERVKDVRITNRLTESPACLVSDQFDISGNLERILKQAGQDVPQVKPILEINPEHALVKRLSKMRSEDKIADFSDILYDQAVLAEGALPEDPAGFVRKINALLTQ